MQLAVCCLAVDLHFILPLFLHSAHWIAANGIVGNLPLVFQIFFVVCEATVKVND